MNAVQMEEKDSVIRFAPIPLVPLHAAVRLAILLLDLLAMVSIITHIKCIIIIIWNLCHEREPYNMFKKKNYVCIMYYV